MSSKPESPSEPFIKPKTHDGTKKLFTCFRILGIVMPKKHKLLYVFYAIIVNLFSIIIVPMVFTLSYVVGAGKMEISHFLTSLQVGINVYACAAKFLFIAFMRKRLFKIETILEKLDARAKYPEEFDEIRKAVEFGNHAVIFFFSLYSFYATSTFLGAFYMSRPPYSLYIPFIDWRLSKRNFIVVSAMEYFLIDIAAFQDLANDVYAVIYVKMVHIHMNILIMRIQRIATDLKATQEDNLKELVNCIVDHKNIIDLLNAVAPVISPTIFVQCTVSAIALGTTLINIRITEDTATNIGTGCFIIVLVVQILPVCYLLNCLAEDGDRLPDAIFHMNWMDQNMEFRRMCLFFMHRSQQRIYILAGKMFPISLDTFVSIMKFSFSIYTIMGEMNFATKFD